MRWILLLLAVAGFVVVFTTKSPGVLGIALAVAVFCSFGFVLSLAAARISANAQPESMLIVDPDVASLRARTQKLRQIQSNVRANADARSEQKLDSES